MTHLLIGLAALLLTGCTILEGPDGSNQTQHTDTLPAVVVCLLSACDSTFSDRAERAGSDTTNDGSESVDQVSSATPTVNIPLTGGGLPTEEILDTVPDAIPDALTEVVE